MSGQNTTLLEDLSATGIKDSTTYLRGDNTWSVVAGSGSDATSIQGVAINSTVPNDEAINNQYYIAKWLQNLIKYSSDLSQGPWLKTAVSIDGTDGIIPSSSSTTQRVFQTMAMTIGESSAVKARVKKENTGRWLAIVTPLATTSDRTFFDLQDGVLGNIGAGVNNAEIELDDDGYYNIGIDFTANIASQSVRFHIVSGNGVTNGQGDGVSVHVRMMDAHCYSGTLADNYEYVATTTTAETGRQEYQLVDANILSESTPSSATDTGVKGKIVYDADYIYMCVATDTWERVAIATW